MDEHLETIKAIVDSFIKMCDCIEECADLGCGGCPVSEDCFKNKKHQGLNKLIEFLEKA